MAAIPENCVTTTDSVVKIKVEPGSTQKLCLVCGDRALGYNFNAISCESCKAFFRRNANTDKTFKCPFKNACEITTLTRKFCQKCRLKKCFAAGMVKEYIMSEEDKAEKRRKIEENRAKKRSADYNESSSSKIAKKCDDTAADSSDSDVNIQYNVLNSTTSPPQTLNDVNYDPVPHLSNSNDNLQHPSYAKNYEPDYSQPVLQRPQSHNSESNQGNYESYTPSSDSYFESSHHSSSTYTSYVEHDRINNRRDPDNIFECVDSLPYDPNSMESILSEAVQLEFEAFTSMSQLHSSGRELNEVERAKLNELIVAHKALNAPIDENMSALIDCVPQFKDIENKADQRPLLTVINLTGVAIRRMIKMAKKINAFKNMCEEDQIALLKGGSLELMVLRSTMSYDCDRNLWKIPAPNEGFSSIDTGVLKLAKGNIYQIYEHFIKTFDPKCRTDENVILIMSAIVLFTTDRPKVVHSDVVKLERNSYYYLLRRYLESIYPGCEAKSKFLKLIQKIKEITKLANEVISVYLDVNPVEPLLIEIFDLQSKF